MEATVNVIEVPAFMEFLKENGLMIGKASDFVGEKEFDLSVRRANLAKKKAVTLKEILDARILKVTSKRSLMRWIDEGKIREGESYKCQKSNQIMVMTSALKRLGFI